MACEPVCDQPRENLGGCVAPSQLRHLVEVAIVDVSQDTTQRLGGRADIHHDVVGVELDPGEGRVHDVSGSVQALGRTEQLTAEAVRDHHVVTDGDTEHQSYPSSYVSVWQTARRRPSDSRAITSGSSSNVDSPVSSASKAGSRSRSSASARRSAVVRRPRRATATSPTWLARMPRRREWKAAPRDSWTDSSPYQLRSTTVWSAASKARESWSPADVALAWNTRS